MSIKYNSLQTEYKDGVWLIPDNEIKDKCKYCESNEDDKNISLKIKAVENNIELFIEGDSVPYIYDYEVKINYCPMCGRKFGEL